MIKTVNTFILLISLVVSLNVNAISCSSFLEDAAGGGVSIGIQSLDQSLIDKITKLENDYGVNASLTPYVLAEVTDAKMQIENLKVSMNFRERHLWGWLARFLGADSKKINEFKTRRERLKELDGRIQEAAESDQRRERSIVDTVDQFLKNEDERFNVLRKAQEELSRVICNGNQCMASIEEALSSISLLSLPADFDVSSLDTKSNFVEWGQDPSRLSLYGVNGPLLNVLGVKDQTSQAFEDALAFHKSLADAHKAAALSKIDPDAPVTGPVHFILNSFLSLNIQDGLSAVYAKVFQTFKFEEVQDQLEDLHTEVREQTERAQADYDKLKEDLDSVVCSARELCR